MGPPISNAAMQMRGFYCIVTPLIWLALSAAAAGLSPSVRRSTERVLASLLKLPTATIDQGAVKHSSANSRDVRMNDAFLIPVIHVFVKKGNNSQLTRLKSQVLRSSVRIGSQVTGHRVNDFGSSRVIGRCDQVLILSDF